MGRRWAARGRGSTGGRGNGRALLEALLGWADARGLVRVALEVVETNTRAIRLYESLGFEHEGRLRCRRKHGALYLDSHQMARVRTPSANACTPRRSAPTPFSRN